jgi:hypothetical protein
MVILQVGGLLFEKHSPLHSFTKRHNSSFELPEADSIRYEEYVKSPEGLYPNITFLAEFLQHEDQKLGPEPPRGFVLKVQRSRDTNEHLCYKFTDVNGDAQGPS